MEINLENKRLYHFLGIKNFQTLAALWAGSLSCNKKKLERRTQLDEPVECTSGGDQLLFYKILHLLFFLLVRFLCALRLESRKKITLSTRSQCRTLRISVSSAKGMSHQPIQNSVALFRGHRKNTRFLLP